MDNLLRCRFLPAACRCLRILAAAACCALARYARINADSCAARLLDCAGSVPPAALPRLAACRSFIPASAVSYRFCHARVLRRLPFLPCVHRCLLPLRLPPFLASWTFSPRYRFNVLSLASYRTPPASGALPARRRARRAHCAACCLLLRFKIAACGLLRLSGLVTTCGSAVLPPAPHCLVSVTWFRNYHLFALLVLRTRVQFTLLPLAAWTSFCRYCLPFWVDLRCSPAPAVYLHRGVTA